MSEKPRHDAPQQPEADKQSQQPDTENRDILLTHHEAEAGSPADIAVCGEEDPGVGLEILVMREDEEE